MSRPSFTDFQGYLFDLDGCLYRGSEPVPGAGDLLTLLRSLNKKIVFLSNNSSQTAHEVAQRLARMGIDAHPQDILVPTDSAGAFLRESFGQITVYPIGSGGISASLVAAGLEVAGPSSPHCDVVFVARDVEFSFEKLQAAVRFIQGGAALVAANQDSYHPGMGGLRVPETGALVAAIVEVVGHPARTLGKPEPYLFRKALERLGLAPEAVVMVGDNLDTDIAGARNAGLSSVWIDPDRRCVAYGKGPTWTCRNLKELLSELQRDEGGKK